MRLLFLSHRLPCPPHKGEKIRALNIIRFLARTHEMHLASLVDDVDDLRYLSLLQPHLRTLLLQRIHPRPRKALALAALLGSESITGKFFYSRNLQRRVDELIEGARIEAVFCSSSPMAEYVLRSRHAERLRSMRRMMDLIDVDSVKWREYAERSGPWTAWLYRREAERLAQLELRIGGEFDRVLVVSEAERKCCPAGMPEDRITVMPNGVDLEFFSPDRILPSPDKSPILLFTGMMDYRPNVEGVCWFVEHVLPRIRDAVPDVQLYIVGNRPARPVRRLAMRPGVVVTGFVPDVREYLKRATVCIAPLRIARGIQNKVLEAMAMARPVVSTPQAFEGIEAQPGRDLLVAATGPEFAQQVIGLLRDRRRASQMGQCARGCIEQRHSWSNHLRVLDELLREASPVDRGSIPAESQRLSSTCRQSTAMHSVS